MHACAAEREVARRQSELLAQCEQADVRPQRKQAASEAVFAASGRATDDVARKGMDEKSAEFRKRGEVYVPRD